MINKSRFMSGNALKILAALSMLIDHVGLMFFPNEIIFRIIGRLAFPIFAFMISEGARYTKNKLRYFLLMFSLAAVCQVVYYFFDDGNLYMCILVTFSLSILLIYALRLLKVAVFSMGTSIFKKILALLFFLACLSGVCLLNIFFEIDYGFGGIVVPVFASLFDFRGIDVPDSIRWLDCIPMRLVALSVGLLLLALGTGVIQFFSLLALIPLFLYSGKRGKYKMKYFFYLFYPLHLVALEAIYIVLNVL